MSGSRETERNGRTKWIFHQQSDVFYRILKGDTSCLFLCICTSVVDVSRDLYVTQLRVDWKLIEVFVFLQRKFSSQRQRVPVLIHLVDH